MKNLFVKWFILAALLSFSIEASPQDGGADLWKKNCRSCHTIGGGTLVGPDLKDITERRDMDWIRPFIKSSQAMIEAGDSLAVALYEEFNQASMNDHTHLSDENIDSIMTYGRARIRFGAG